MLKDIGGAAALALVAGTALAKPKTLTVAGYGGSWEQELRKDVLVAKPDWDTVNDHREEWTKRWNREVER
jgi:hypothetical protein